MLDFHFILTLILIAAVMGAVQGTCAYLILLERKISAWAQDRIGPNRVGPFGLLQPIVDGLKFLLKEEIIPNHVDKLFYLLGPAVAMATALFAFCVVPFGQTTTPPVLEDRRTDDMVRATQAWLAGRDGRGPSAADSPAALREALKDNTDYRAESRGPVWPQTEAEMEFVLAADRAYAA